MQEVDSYETVFTSGRYEKRETFHNTRWLQCKFIPWHCKLTAVAEM